jgi:urea carboxylase-associated protein 2
MTMRPEMTSTLDGALAHARSQAGTSEGSPVTIPSTAAGDLPPGVESSDVIWDETIEGGGYSSRFLPRGAHMRTTDVDGDACLQLLVYNATLTSERLNVADTVKVQWQAYLGREALLLSDMGRALMTIVDDTSGCHDALCGGSNQKRNAARYGNGSVSGPAPNARDLLAIAAAKQGLGRIDIGPCINLFKAVTVDVSGDLHFNGAPAAARTFVELRAEIDAIVLLANTPHPLDDRPDYTVTPARITAWRAEPTRADDKFRATTPERERAFLNTDEFLAGSR